MPSGSEYEEGPGDPEEDHGAEEGEAGEDGEDIQARVGQDSRRPEKDKGFHATRQQHQAPSIQRERGRGGTSLKRITYTDDIAKTRNISCHQKYSFVLNTILVLMGEGKIYQ